MYQIWKVSINFCVEFDCQKNSVDFYSPLHNQLNGKCRSVPTLQGRDWLEWKSLKLMPLWMTSAKQIDGSILCVFLAKSFCIFYHCLRASHHVPCKSKYHWVLFSYRLRAILSDKWKEYLVCSKDTSAKFCDATETLVGHISWGVKVGGVWSQPDGQLIRMVRGNRFPTKFRTVHYRWLHY